MNTLVRPVGTERRPRLSLLLLRIVATVNLVLVAAQPVLAGLFLTGNVDAIEVHGAVGTAVGLVQLVVLAVAVAYVISRGRLWVLLAALVLAVAAVVQITLGYTRTLQIHIPLGVAVVTAAVLLAVWVWTPAAARPRGGAR